MKVWERSEKSYKKELGRLRKGFKDYGGKEGLRKEVNL